MQKRANGRGVSPRGEYIACKAKTEKKVTPGGIIKGENHHLLKMKDMRVENSRQKTGRQ